MVESVELGKDLANGFLQRDSIILTFAMVVIVESDHYGGLASSTIRQILIRQLTEAGQVRKV